MSHIQFEVVRNDDGKVVFTTKGSRYDARTATERFVLSQLRTKLEFVATLGGKPFLDSNPTANALARNAVEGVVKQHILDPLLNVPWSAQKGQQGSAKTAAFTVKWTCLSRMSPRRPQHIIDAEKAMTAANQSKKQAERDARKKAAEQRIINARKRIINQINYAFSQGKSGTEPAAKYITCQHCDAPAAFVTLKHALPKGASVLDEDILTGAGCAEHTNWFYRHEKILCANLEFFYDGIRQIAIKP